MPLGSSELSSLPASVVTLACGSLWTLMVEVLVAPLAELATVDVVASVVEAVSMAPSGSKQPMMGTRLAETAYPCRAFIR